MALDPEYAAALAELGIFEPDEDNELHRRLVDALSRTRRLPEMSRISAIRFVCLWDMGRYGEELAEARAAYDALHAKVTLRHRVAGEKSGEMCRAAADADPEVEAAHLRYRLAEQLERLARKRLDAIDGEFEAARSLNANRRAADRGHADGSTP